MILDFDQTNNHLKGNHPILQHNNGGPKKDVQLPTFMGRISADRKWFLKNAWGLEPQESSLQPEMLYYSVAVFI